MAQHADKEPTEPRIRHTVYLPLSLEVAFLHTTSNRVTTYLRAHREKRSIERALKLCQQEAFEEAIRDWIKKQEG